MKKKTKTLCCEEMVGKYADAILICLRLDILRQWEPLPLTGYLEDYDPSPKVCRGMKNSDIVEWVQNAVGIRQIERKKMTRKNYRTSVDRSIQWSLRILKKKGLVETTRRGYQKITQKGINSRYTHEELIRFYRDAQIECKIRRKIAS